MKATVKSFFFKTTLKNTELVLELLCGGLLKKQSISVYQ